MAGRTIVVFGVTGVQGSSVARALLEDGFKIRGITRNPESASSKKMGELGVELVRGDLNDPASYCPAFKEADGVFLTSNFMALYDGSNSQEAKAQETKQCIDAVDAAAAAGVPHIVYSTLDSRNPEQEVSHFASKAAVSKYIKERGYPATHLYTSFYFSNFLLMKPYEQDGKIVLPLQLMDDTVIPGMDASQLGLWARVAFRDPKAWIGKDMYPCNENITLAQVAKTLSELSGKEYTTLHLTPEQFAEYGENNKMDHELWLNYNAFVNGDVPRNPAEWRKLVPEARGFKEWALATPAAAEKFGPFK